MFRPRFLLSPALSFALLFGAGWLLGCGPDEPSSQTDLRILRFEASPAHLSAAGDVTIRWVTRGAASLELLQDEQALDLETREIAAGSMVVPLSESATFTLIARDASDRLVIASREVTVETSALPRIAELSAPEEASPLRRQL